MRGLADGLDADSAYLSPQEVKQVGERRRARRPGDVGLDLTTSVLPPGRRGARRLARGESGLRTGDYVRAIDNQPTREMSVWEGHARAARRAGHAQ